MYIFTFTYICSRFSKFFKKHKIFCDNFYSKLFSYFFHLEQIPFETGFSWTKTEHESRLKTYSLPKDCKAIYYEYKKITPVKSIDIMWFASNNNVYTANGYSGYMPPYFEDTIPKNCVIKK